MNFKNPVFGLLTDFGFDFAVASMKALLLQEVPTGTLVDVDHSVEKFSITSGAFILEKVYHYFPRGTSFICIIDPGVGSKRHALCVESDGYLFFGPDNGLLSYFINKPSTNVFIIDETILPPASYTFHGRDLFVPAAAAYHNGRRDFLIPVTKETLVQLPCNTTNIVYIDSFGNLKTSIAIDKKFNHNELITLSIGNKKYTIPFVHTFSQTEKGTLICYKGSNNTLEIAVNLGSAKNYLNTHVGESIQII